MNSPTIRPAISTDAAQIANVHVRSWQQAYRELFPADYLSSLDQTLPQRKHHWAQALAAGELNVFVAIVDEQLIGWIAVGASRDKDADPQRCAEVMAIYVLAEHWRTGVGAKLWRAGVEPLIEQGYNRATLWVLAENHRAIEFYRRAGWAEEPGSEVELVKGGVTLKEVRYGASDLLTHRGQQGIETNGSQNVSQN
jgi:ribosomal protein S18 acetylase RimI-like enzyme